MDQPLDQPRLAKRSARASPLHYPSPSGICMTKRDQCLTAIRLPAGIRVQPANIMAATERIPESERGRLSAGRPDEGPEHRPGGTSRVPTPDSSDPLVRSSVRSLSHYDYGDRQPRRG